MPTGVMAPTSQGAILTRLTESEQVRFAPDGARAILALTFTDEDRRRIHELVERNQEDALPPEEQTELDKFMQVSYLPDLIHSKHRRCLNRAENKRTKD